MKEERGILSQSRPIRIWGPRSSGSVLKLQGWYVVRDYFLDFSIWDFPFVTKLEILKFFILVWLLNLTVSLIFGRKLSIWGKEQFVFNYASRLLYFIKFSFLWVCFIIKVFHGKHGKNQIVCMYLIAEIFIGDSILPNSMVEVDAQFDANEYWTSPMYWNPW